MSSADPYLMMFIKNDEDRQVHDGSDKVFPETLSPDFFEATETFPIRLQDDWCLHVDVMDQANFSFQNSLIGRTQIDIEERRWSMQHVIAKLIFQQELEICQDKMKEIQTLKQQNRRKKDNNYKEKEKLIGDRRLNISKIFDKFKKKDMPLSKVEYRPLSHPDKEQA